MYVCVDVDYRDDLVRAAALGFERWDDATSSLESVVQSAPSVAEYQPGEFYRRELPCILSVLQQCGAAIDVVIVDGYAWLGADRPGLGARLFDALDQRIPVIGAAKNRFTGANPELVLRGQSQKPLFVTAVGLEATAAAASIRQMHGAHRVPTLLKRVDSLARGLASPREPAR